MRIMALDVGDRKIGVAISDAMQLIAQGKPTLKRTTTEADIERLRNLVTENDVHRIIIGEPLHMDGRPSPQSLKTAKFARKLQKATQIPVVLWDERLSSFAAEEHLAEMGLNWRKRREQVDKMAAMIILQGYLDRQKGPNLE
jgi:putative Holliday junction resolvase